MINDFLDALFGILSKSGIAAFFVGDGWKNLIMIAVACTLFVLAIKFKFEPLLLLPIAFGMLLANLPNAGIYHPEIWQTTIDGALNSAYWTQDCLISFILVLNLVFIRLLFSWALVV